MLVLVGLIGTSLKIPLVQSVLNEFSVIGSLWGNYNELTEVISLARMKKLKIPRKHYKLSEAGKALADLEAGKIHGRAILVP